MNEKITPGSEELSLVGYAPPVWITSTFAPEWYADALKEARTGNTRDARRREIVFAACAAESYLVEWVRDSVLNRKFERLAAYFPRQGFVGVLDRWKNVVKQLAADGLIAAPQDFSGKAWQDFVDLVEYRNGLVHGRSSRPASAAQPSQLAPFPSTDLLDELSPGWAVRVIQTLLNELHATIGTPVPSWLVAP